MAIPKNKRLSVDLDDMDIKLDDNVRIGQGITANLPDILIVKNSVADFPNVGDKNRLYLDRSTGDVYSYGYVGDYYSSVGTASGDTIYGGDANTNI